MSEDAGRPDSSIPPDSAASAEELPLQKSLIILKVKSGGMHAVESFLRNRGWVIYSTENLRDVLSFLIQHNPPFLMVPSDHSNPKVRQLPKIVAQAFVVQVITYCEKASGLGVKNLHEMNHPYKLFPPVSGPSIERMILKIQREIAMGNQIGAGTGPKSLNPAEDAATIVQQSRNEHGQLITFEGQKAKTGAAYMPSLGGPPSDRPSLAALLSALDDKGDSVGSDSESGSNFPQSNPQAKKPGGFFGNAAGPPSSQPPDRKGQKESAGSELTGSTTKETAEGHTDSSDLTNKPTAIWPSSSGESAPGENSDLADPQIAPTSTVGQISTGPRVQIQRGKVAAESTDKDFRSLIEKATQQALTESVEPEFQRPTKALQEKASTVACIRVESERFNGYLIGASATGRVLDDEFLQTLEFKIQHFLREMGELTKESNGILRLKILPIEFEKWTLDYAEFLAKSIHKDEEVALAFFPGKVADPELLQSNDEKMVQIDLQEIRSDVPVEFDLYLFMPENNKYVLYTPTGRKLAADQRQRLSLRGIQKMHLRKDNVPQVSRYRVQNFLNDKIREYSDKKST